MYIMEIIVYVHFHERTSGVISKLPDDAKSAESASHCRVGLSVCHKPPILAAADSSTRFASLSQSFLSF